MPIFITTILGILLLCVRVDYVKIRYIAAYVVDLDFGLDFGNGIIGILETIFVLWTRLDYAPMQWITSMLYAQA